VSVKAATQENVSGYCVVNSVRANTDDDDISDRVGFFWERCDDRKTLDKVKQRKGGESDGSD
jgi:hypothetical protein